MDEHVSDNHHPLCWHSAPCGTMERWKATIRYSCFVNDSFYLRSLVLAPPFNISCFRNRSTNPACTYLARNQMISERSLYAYHCLICASVFWGMQMSARVGWGGGGHHLERFYKNMSNKSLPFFFAPLHLLMCSPSPRWHDLTVNEAPPRIRMADAQRLQ